MPRRAELRRALAGAALALLTVAGTLGASSEAGFAASRRTGRVPLPPMGPSLRSTVAFATAESAGTIIIRKDEKALYLVGGNGQALRYRISVGRDGFGWTGTVKVGDKQEWPEWRPPAEMRAREPGLPEFVPAGPYNPLGARALYLYKSGRDTLFRIHGTNDPNGVGFDGTSGCFRLTNTDVIDLYGRVGVGTKVIVQ